MKLPPRTSIWPWVLFWAWAGGIYYLSSLKPEELLDVPTELLSADKLVHAVAFALGGWLLGKALRRTFRWSGARLFFGVVGGIALYGAFDELHQLFTPGRSGADILDWTADMVGGSLAAFVYCWLHGPARNAAGTDSATS